MAVQDWDFFISYSHRDIAYARRLHRALSARGVRVWWDERLTVGRPFGLEIQQALDKSKRVLVLWSKNSVTSEWVQQEASHARALNRVRPYRIDDCTVPVGFNALHTGALGNPDKASETILQDAGAQLVPGSRSVTIRDAQTYLEKLPATAAENLFGRERELDLLFNAWDAGKSGVVVLQAMGGQGKTALMRHWVQTMMECSWRGASRIYVESFYSQGTDEKRGGSADAFFTHALDWFGYSGPKLTSRSAEGEELAKLLQRERTLLVLDGLEPLQYPAQRSGMAGELKDPGLKALILQLAHQTQCMCVITTRFPLPELKSMRPPTVIVEPLSPLSEEAGARLLRSLKIRGGDGELRAAVRDLDGHALAVSLLGRYLADFSDCDIAQRSSLPAMVEHAGDRSMRRVMRRYEVAYEERIREQGKKPGASASARQLELLRIMGLFDRPAERQAITAIFSKPAIPGMTDAGAGMSDDQLNFAITQLRQNGLLFPPTPGQPNQLDAHPLIREYFADRLKTVPRAGPAEANRRLFSYFLSQARATKADNTIDALEPYLAAITHACGAGLYAEGFNIFVEHVSRGTERFASKALGAHGSIVATLVHFFEDPWKAVVPKLELAHQVRVASTVGFALRSLGRLPDAAEAFQTAAHLEAKVPGAKRYISLRHLSDTWLALGEISKAVAAGEEAVRLCGSGEPFQKALCLVILARGLHLSGERERALRAFLEAEKLFAGEQASRSMLHGWQGYFLTDLLLEMGQEAEARRRTPTQSSNVLGVKRLDAALDHLAVGIIRLQDQKYAEAETEIDQAVHGIGDAGEMFHLPAGLLARATLLRVSGRLEEARNVLAQVQDICDASKLRLVRVDHDIEQMRLDIMGLKTSRPRGFLTGPRRSAWKKERQKVLTTLAALRTEVEQTGYKRRASAVEQLTEEAATLG